MRTWNPLCCRNETQNGKSYRLEKRYKISFSCRHTACSKLTPWRKYVWELSCLNRALPVSGGTCSVAPEILQRKDNTLQATTVGGNGNTAISYLQINLKNVQQSIFYIVSFTTEALNELMVTLNATKFNTLNNFVHWGIYYWYTIWKFSADTNI